VVKAGVKRLAVPGSVVCNFFQIEWFLLGFSVTLRLLKWTAAIPILDGLECRSHVNREVYRSFCPEIEQILNFLLVILDTAANLW